MRRSAQLILLSFLLPGGVAMSQISSPNQELLDVFLREIDYSAVAHNLPADKKILVDWDRATSKVTDADGFVWNRREGDSRIAYGIRGLGASGVYHATLKSDDQDQVRVEIHSAMSAKAALDFMLQQASLVTTLRINDRFLKHPACYADFCLERKSDSDKEARFVYGDKYVHIYGQRDNNKKSVIPIGTALCKIMRAAEQQPGAVARAAPVPQLSVTRSSLKVGETFTVIVDTTNYPSEGWQVDIRTKGEKLEYVDGDYGKEEYEAKASGTETIKAILMNKRTLQFGEMEKQVLIEP
jgi:hypothetical protein